MKHVFLFEVLIVFIAFSCLNKNRESTDLFTNSRLQDSLDIYIESVLSLPKDGIMPVIMDIFIYDIKQDRYIVLDTYADAEKVLPLETWDNEVLFKSLRPGTYKGVITRVAYTPDCSRLINKRAIKAFPRGYMKHQPWSRPGETPPLPYVYRKYKLLPNEELILIPGHHISSH